MSFLSLRSSKKFAKQKSDRTSDQIDEPVMAGMHIVGYLDKKPAVRKLHNRQEFTALTTSSKPALVFVYLSWCPHCQSKHEPYEALAEEYGDAALFTKIDLEEQPWIGKAYNIQSAPQFLLVHGKELIRVPQFDLIPTALNKFIEMEEGRSLS